MKTKIEDMALELLGLPVAQRALLAKQLIASLDETEIEGIEALWVREVDTRYAEIEKGIVECQPVAEALQEAREKLKEKNTRSKLNNLQIRYF